MINFRERSLDLVLQTGNEQVFNDISEKCTADADLAEMIGVIVKKLKGASLVTERGVDYSQLKNSEPYRFLISEIYPCLRNYNLQQLNSREQRIAFWINLYNLLTIDAVIRFSIKKSVIEGWIGILRFFRQAAYLIGGLRFSLADIEHGILRANRGVSFIPGKHFNQSDPRLSYVLKEIDPRVHFALNCASRSCPPIAFYSADNIDEQLDLATRNFIQNEVVLHKSQVALLVSRIFKWYRKDFGGIEGILSMIKVYIPEDDVRHQLIVNFDYKTMIEFLPYDWHLNELS